MPLALHRTQLLTQMLNSYWLKESKVCIRLCSCFAKRPKMPQPFPFDLIFCISAKLSPKEIENITPKSLQTHTVNLKLKSKLKLRLRLSLKLRCKRNIFSTSCNNNTNLWKWPWWERPRYPSLNS